MSKMAALLASLGAEERELVLRHIDGGTPVRRLAQVLTEHGHPIGKTSISDFRRERRST